MPQENNYFRDTLVTAKGTITESWHTVQPASGTPADAIATPIADGGWVCSEADAWVTELTDKCSGIVSAFFHAHLEVSQRIGQEPEKVEENDPHGNAWQRTWSIRRHNL